MSRRKDDWKEWKNGWKYKKNAPYDDMCICNHNHTEIFYTISRDKRDWLNFQTVTKMPPHNRKRTVNFFIDYGIDDFGK